MEGTPLNIFKETLYFHADLNLQLHNKEQQTFIKPFTL